jgi:hypothetical protein
MGDISKKGGDEQRRLLSHGEALLKNDFHPTDEAAVQDLPRSKKRGGARSKEVFEWTYAGTRAKAARLASF